MRVSKLRAGITLVACLCAYTGLAPVMAEEMQAVRIAAVDADGNSLHGASLFYVTSDDPASRRNAATKGQAIAPQEDGTWVIKAAGPKLALVVEHPSFGSSIVEFAFPGQADAWVLIYVSQGTADAMVVSEKVWLDPPATQQMTVAVLPAAATPPAANSTVAEGPPVDPPSTAHLVASGGEPPALTDEACPANTLNNPPTGQPPHDPGDSWTGGVSDLRTGSGYASLIRYESFSGVTSPICDIHFWGLSLSYPWAACTEDPMTFDITFYQDASGSPGAVVCSYTLALSRIATPDVWAGFPLWRWESFLSPCCTIPGGAGWVSIQGTSVGTPDCWFLWASSPVVDQSSLLLDQVTQIWTTEVFDLSLCLTGEYEETYGACCDDSISFCEDDVEMQDCPPPLRFAALPTTCATLDPPCGAITGACCHEDGTCDYETQVACPSPSIWLGANTSCDDCPCIVPCPPGGIAEAEACGSDTNGGCNSTPEVFEPINCEDTICGTSWFDGSTRDTDWYELVIAEPMIMTIAVEAEFDVLFGKIGQLVDGVPGCANTTGSVDPYAVMGPCDPASVVTFCMPAGTYYIFVAPQFTSVVTCPSDYVLTVTCEPCEQTYCAASGGCDEYISNVTVGTINNSSACDGYADYTAMSTDMVTGAGYGITVTIGNPYSSDKGGLWVDWNQDLDFDDAGEAIVGPTDWAGSGPYVATITPPPGAATGQTRMRVRLQYSGGDPLPCGSTSYGEVEDYSINVLPAPEYGACCEGMICHSDMPEADCIALPGVYQGDGSTCTPNPCKGACCFIDGSCVEHPNEASCNGAGGAYEGDGTDCDPNPCPPACVVDYSMTAPIADHAGNTCGMNNDCDLRPSEDAMYEVTIPNAGDWVFSLCDSSFDTWMAVGTTCCGDELGYNDDACGVQSEMTLMGLAAGTYYVDIEGYSGCGAYELDVYELVPCDVVCVGDDEQETCGDDTNGGCNMATPTFEAIAFGQTKCGTGWADGGTRDTDWYEVVTTEDMIMTWTVEGEFAQAGVVAGMVETTPLGNPDCATATALNPYGTGGECEEIVVTTDCYPPGTYWWFVAPLDYYNLPCGADNDYRATLTGVSCAPPEPPENDDCDNAIGVGALPASVTVDTTLATDDITVPCGVYSGPFKNVWYKVSGTGNTMTATSCTAGTAVSDTKISVFCRDCDDEWRLCVGGNDDDCDPFGSWLSTYTWCSQAGVEYLITVGLYSAYTTPGVIQLDVSDDGTPCDPPTVDCIWPTGACCNDDTCTIENPMDCGLLGGLYVGDDTVCDAPDCQPNGMNDACDIYSGYSQDCNGNGVPDECDIAEGTSDDCQGDGIPDECQLLGAKDVVIDESFEGAFPPPDWQNIAYDANGPWQVTTTLDYVHTGLQAAVHPWSTPDTADSYLLTPELTINAGSLSVWSIGCTDYDWCDYYDIDVMIVIGDPDAAGGSDDIYLGTLNDLWVDHYTTWVEGVYNLTPYLTGGPFRIGFRYTGLDGDLGVIDDVLIEGASGPLPNDCNGNGIPDECDIATEDGGYCPCDGCPTVCSADCQPNGVPDECDIAEGTSQDDDQDGIPQECDNCPDDYNPGQANSDGDTHGDACDNCPTVDNQNQANSDNDSHGDACDNCPTVDNENQANSDNDSHGDACDNCPTVDNENQANGDGDSYGDACDNCPEDWNEDQADGDQDTVGDVCDNCIDVPNPLQTNSDVTADPPGDTLGDACDNCPVLANEDQADADGDSDPGRAYCQYDTGQGHGGDVCDVCPADDCHRDLDQNGIMDCAQAGYIPTVSAWGLLVLALLLLTGAKVYFRRRTA